MATFSRFANVQLCFGPVFRRLDLRNLTNATNTGLQRQPCFTVCMTRRRSKLRRLRRDCLKMCFYSLLSAIACVADGNFHVNNRNISNDSNRRYVDVVAMLRKSAGIQSTNQSKRGRSPVTYVAFMWSSILHWSRVTISFHLRGKKSIFIDRNANESQLVSSIK